MAFNRKEAFTLQEQELADFAKAIAHPARIAILKVLIEKNTCICGEIVEVLPLAQSTVSQHLKELKSAGLIQGTISGPRSCYCIDHEKFLKFNMAFNALFISVTEQKSKCC